MSYVGLSEAKPNILAHMLGFASLSPTYVSTSSNAVGA